MCATWKFELSKHYLCKKRELLLKKMSKYQNIKIVNKTAALNREDELALLLIGSKESWMYQLLFFTISLRYFVDHHLNSRSGILL